MLLHRRWWLVVSGRRFVGFFSAATFAVHGWPSFSHTLLADYTKADGLTESRDVDGALVELMSIAEKEGDAAKTNVDLLWRLARAQL